MPPRQAVANHDSGQTDRRDEGSQQAEIYLGGPLTVAAAAVAGRIENPKEVFDEL